MTKRITDTQPVKDFIELANKYCRFIEQRDKYSEIEMYQWLYQLIPQLCLSAMNLPDIKRCEYYRSKSFHLAWKEIYTSLQLKFKTFNDRYLYIAPYQDDSDDSKEPWERSISNDLAEVFQDIAPGIEDWEKANIDIKKGIVWGWKFGYENHWGDHATSVFRAIHFLLYERIEDNCGDYVGLRKID